MLNKYARAFFTRVLTPFAAFLLRRGVRPDTGTLIGTGANPNVAAVVVIGIEPAWTKRVVDGIAATGKPVTGFSIELNGEIATIAAASRVTKEYVQGAS